MGSSEECGRCGGTGWALGEGDAVRCTCKTAEQQDTRWRSVGVGRRHRPCTLDNYDPPTPATVSALDDCRRYADGWPHDRDGRGILLLGTVGIGKTHLAAAVCKVVSDAGATVVFIAWPQLLGEMRRRIGKEQAGEEPPANTWPDIMECDLLVLDELAGERPTLWTADMLGELIGHRYNHMLPIIMTANLSGTALRDWLGDRMSSRVAEVCSVHLLRGPDYRKTKR